MRRSAVIGFPTVVLIMATAFETRAALAQAAGTGGGSPATIMGIDWATFLISVAAAAMILVALVLAGLTLFVTFVGLPRVERLIEQRVNTMSEQIERDLSGRINGYVGFIFGQLYKAHSDIDFFIEEAMNYSRKSYDQLEPGREFKSAAMNNWAFYASLRGNRSDAPDAIRFAQSLRTGYPSSRDEDHLTTFAAVVATYYSHFQQPKSKVTEAIWLMEDMLKKSLATERNRESARRHLKELHRAQAELEQQQG